MKSYFFNEFLWDLCGFTSVKPIIMGVWFSLLNDFKIYIQIILYNTINHGHIINLCDINNSFYFVAVSLMTLVDLVPVLTSVYSILHSKHFCIIRARVCVLGVCLLIV